MSFDAGRRRSERTLTVGVTLLIVMAIARAAAADLVVISNRSSAQGAASIFLGGDVLERSSLMSPPGPTTGTFVWRDTVTSNALGAASTVSSDIRTSISSSGISGSGSTTTVVSSEGSGGGTAVGGTGAQLNVLLTSPQLFSYAATFVLESAGSYPGLALHAVAGLTLISALGDQAIFLDQLASLGGPTPSGTHTLAHSGLLLPGLYVLSGGLASIFQHSTPESPNSRGRIAFEFAFRVTPVASPVPEPATLTLLGTALAGLAARARVRSARRQR